MYNFFVYRYIASTVRSKCPLHFTVGDRCDNRIFVIQYSMHVHRVNAQPPIEMFRRESNGVNARSIITNNHSSSAQNVFSVSGISLVLLYYSVMSASGRISKDDNINGMEI